MISPDDKQRLSKVARAIVKSRVLASREDPNAFAEYAFKDAVTGAYLQQADCHREMQDAYHSTDPYRILEYPRAHGKTTQMEIAILWELGNDPNLRYKIVGESDPKAIERLELITRHIEFNDRVHDVFPHLRPADKGSWTKKKIFLARDRIMRDASIEACGVTSSATGGRADRLIGDDPVGRRNALDIPKLRATVKRSWDSDWINLLDPGGRVRYYATPWHKDDLTHHIKANSEYVVVSRPIGSNYEPVWPERWPSDALRTKARLIGATEFNRGWRLIALSGEFSTIQKEFIKFCEVGATSKFYEFIATGYDLSTGEGEDYFASVTAAVLNDSIYILDGWRERITVHSQIAALVKEAVLYKPDKIGIEVIQYQAVLPQLLKDISGLPPIVPIRPRVSKGLRLAGIQPLFERGQIIFASTLDPARAPRDGRRIKSDEECLVGELTDFPVAPHDDFVDAFVEAVNLCLDYMLVRQSEREDAKLNDKSLEDVDSRLHRSDHITSSLDVNRDIPNDNDDVLELWMRGDFDE